MRTTCMTPVLVATAIICAAQASVAQVVLIDEGKAKTATTTTMKDDIYAFVVGQKGLMAGLGIQGNKITKITPK
jgi:lipid-binding SYLF domain-containing protein